MQPQIITIIGNVASGKSSAAPIVVDALRAEFLDADSLFQTECPFRDVFLQNPKRWALTNELWLTIERARLLREALPKLKDKQRLVVDSGLLMSWVYCYSHFLSGTMTKAEWDMYSELYELLTEELLDSMCVIMLCYATETLMKRLQRRGRQYELEYYTETYLQQLEKGLETLETLLKEKKIMTLAIEEKEIPDFVDNKVGAESLKQLVLHSLSTT